MENLEQSRDTDTSGEVLYLVQRFLSVSPCRQAAEALKRELAQLNDRDVGGYLPKDLLLRACHQASSLLQEKHPQCLPNLKPSFLGAGRQSLCRNTSSKGEWPLRKCQAQRHGAPLHCPSDIRKPLPLVGRIRGREYTGCLSKRTLFSRSFLQSLDRSSARILGHLASVFCVTFDASGEYIFTGADDNLVKVWSAKNGRLLFTFRGSAGEITDLTVSQENSLVAAGSVDKIIRVWSLQNGSPVAVLHSHTAMITSIHFLPYVDGEARYMISTANDCTLCFWKWNSVTQEFSPGGHFVATGCTDHCVRIYHIRPAGPVKIFEQEAHTDRVDSLQWAHNHLRFVSGSKDGTAKIWKFERQNWTEVLLKVPDSETEKGGAMEGSGRAPKGSTLKMSMVAWNGDDSLVVTASSDFLLRIWDSVEGTFLRYLKGHKDEAYVLEPHPVSPWLFLSASHDGCLILWDLRDGVSVKQRHNKIEGRGHGAFFDAHFSPDGTYVGAVDSHGGLTVMTLETNETLKQVPEEQFFNTDYRPLVRDANGYVLDDQTQMAPHLMSPPDLVMADGTTYPPEMQRLVPGKERCSIAHLLRQRILRTDESERVDVELSTDDEEGSAPVSGVEVSSGDVVPQCAWLKRWIVRPLSVSENDKSMARRSAQGEFEEEVYGREMKKAPLPVRDEPTSVAAGEEKDSPGRALRRRRLPKLLHAYQTRTNPRPSETVSSNDFVDPDSVRELSSRNSDSSGIGSEETSSSSEGETSDTNYSGEEAGPSTSGSRTRVRRTRLRVKKGEAREVSEHSEMEEEMEDEPRRQERRRRRSPSRDPSPSRLPSPRRPTERLPKRSLRKRITRKRNSNSSAEEDDLIPDHLSHFPDWLIGITPKKFPYFPQIGDEVVYFRQGYENYLDLVVKRNLYEPTKKMRPKQDLDSEEFAVVDQVKYELSPYRLCSLRLSQLNAKTGGRTGLSFYVKYHDMNDVVDFIILKQVYDKSLRHKWKPGDRFQAVIDESWWFGTVERREALSDQFPRSHYLCLKVKWDNGEDEQMSPWDLETLDPSICPGKNGRSLLAHPADLESLAHYEESERDWSDRRGMDERRRRIVDAMGNLATVDGVEMFLQPVNLAMYPDYSANVAYPVDLGTVKSRVENGFYRREVALEFDVRQMAVNAKHYNESSSPICRQAMMLHEALIRFIRNPESEDDIVAIYNSLELVSLEDLNRNFMAKEVNYALLGGTGKKKARVSSESDGLLSESWQSECRGVLNVILASDDSSPFRNSDDNPEISDIFDNSFNLTQISERLGSGEYSSPEEFQTEINNLLQNIRSMATNKRSPVFKKALSLHSLFGERMNPVMEKWKRAQEVSASKAQRRLRKKPRNHEYNTRAQRNRPVPQARPTLTYSTDNTERSFPRNQKRKECEPSTSTSQDSSDPVLLTRMRKTGSRRRNNSHRSENGEEGTSDVYNSYSEEEERPIAARSPRKRQELRNGRDSMRTRYGGKRVVRYVESSDEDWSEAHNSEEASVVLSQSSRGRLRKLKRYDFQM